MAVIPAKVEVSNDGMQKVTWANLRNGDTGLPVRSGRFADKTVGVIVVAAGVGDVVTMEGSQDGGAAFAASNSGELHDPQGGLLSAVLTGATISDLEAISENPEFFRPNITAGDGTTDLTVVVTMPMRGA